MNLDEFLGSEPAEIQELLSSHGNLDEDFVVSLLERLKSVLAREDNLLLVEPPIIVCGDIHGQLYDLFRLFSLSAPLPESRYLFMGDYVDRGYQSLFTFIYLAYLKVKYQTAIFLLRGNHETTEINAQYGLQAECLKAYGHSGMWSVLNEVFNYLPIAAIVDNRIFCVHGGLSPNAKLVDKVCIIDRFSGMEADSFFQDLCWSDPDETAHEFILNARGHGWLFGARQAAEFLELNGLSLIARAHQMVREGMQWLFDRKVVTVWSAPNYAYKSGNLASIMRVEENEKIEFETFQEDTRSSERPLDASQVMDYFV
jgi:diadenosine tetraphosphatase ApaH/serine/threonine PP2A family protein phosphatase